jgi:hypothetical protein
MTSGRLRRAVWLGALSAALAMAMLVAFVLMPFRLRYSQATWADHAWSRVMQLADLSDSESLKGMGRDRVRALLSDSSTPVPISRTEDMWTIERHHGLLIAADATLWVTYDENDRVTLTRYESERSEGPFALAFVVFTGIAAASLAFASGFKTENERCESSS